MTAPAPAPMEMPAMWDCRACGERITEDHDPCPHCGTERP